MQLSPRAGQGCHHAGRRHSRLLHVDDLDIVCDLVQVDQRGSLLCVLRHVCPTCVRHCLHHVVSHGLVPGKGHGGLHIGHHHVPALRVRAQEGTFAAFRFANRLARATACTVWSLSHGLVPSKGHRGLHIVHHHVPALRAQGNEW